MMPFAFACLLYSQTQKNIRLLAFDDVTGSFVIAMEFCGGGSLMGTLKMFGGKGIPSTMLGNLLMQMAEGLSYLHENRVMHR